MIDTDGIVEYENHTGQVVYKYQFHVDEPYPSTCKVILRVLRTEFEERIVPKPHCALFKNSLVTR